MRPIGLEGFNAKFADSDDPWRTFTDRDEALKRRAILTALGPGPWGRVLEIAAGNGSNSAAIAPRALRLDATEATSAGAALVAKAVRPFPRARAIRLAVPSRFPRSRYDAIVIAEVLYYLTPSDMAQTGHDVGKALGRRGRLILAHHRIDFPDFTQHAALLQWKFLAATGRRWRVRTVRRRGKWIVLTCSPRDRRVRNLKSIVN